MLHTAKKNTGELEYTNFNLFKKISNKLTLVSFNFITTFQTSFKMESRSSSGGSSIARFIPSDLYNRYYN